MSTLSTMCPTFSVISNSNDYIATRIREHMCYVASHNISLITCAVSIKEAVVLRVAAVALSVIELLATVFAFGLSDFVLLNVGIVCRHKFFSVSTIMANYLFFKVIVLGLCSTMGAIIDPYFVYHTLEMDLKIKDTLVDLAAEISPTFNEIVSILPHNFRILSENETLSSAWSITLRDALAENYVTIPSFIDVEPIHYMEALQLVFMNHGPFLHYEVSEQLPRDLVDHFRPIQLKFHMLFYSHLRAIRNEMVAEEGIQKDDLLSPPYIEPLYKRTLLKIMESASMLTDTKLLLSPIRSSKSKNKKFEDVLLEKDSFDNNFFGFFEQLSPLCKQFSSLTSNDKQLLFAIINNTHSTIDLSGAVNNFRDEADTKLIPLEIKTETLAVEKGNIQFVRTLVRRIEKLSFVRVPILEKIQELHATYKQLSEKQRQLVLDLVHNPHRNKQRNTLGMYRFSHEEKTHTLTRSEGEPAFEVRDQIFSLFPKAKNAKKEVVDLFTELSALESKKPVTQKLFKLLIEDKYNNFFDISTIEKVCSGQADTAEVSIPLPKDKTVQIQVKTAKDIVILNKLVNNFYLKSLTKYVLNQHSAIPSNLKFGRLF